MEGREVTTLNLVTDFWAQVPPLPLKNMVTLGRETRIHEEARL